MNLKTVAIKDLNNIEVIGRTTTNRDPLTLFWTGSGIDINIKASELWIEVETNYSIYENWISVVCNGSWISRQMLPKGRSWVCIFRNMNKTVSKKIQIFKDVQAMSGDEEHCLQIHNIKTDGEILPIKEKELKIEFIGDSITSGEGAIGAVIEEDWISMWFSVINNYAYMTAASLDADFHIISQSGWGVLSSWDNNPNGAIPPIYEKVCGVLSGENNKKLGSEKLYNFDSWQPDVVVINLGTNDSNAFTTDKWVDELTGDHFKQRTNEDGTYNNKDLEKLKLAVISFIQKVRGYNPDPYIIWAYGILGAPLSQGISDAINNYIKLSGDLRIQLLILPEMKEEGRGARFHPGIKAHEAAAKVLIDKIKSVI